MTLKIYEYKNCGTCRKALKYLDGQGIAYEKTVMQVHDDLCSGGSPANVADALARLWYAGTAIAGLTPAVTSKT